MTEMMRGERAFLPRAPWEGKRAAFQLAPTTRTGVLVLLYAFIAASGHRSEIAASRRRSCSTESIGLLVSADHGAPSRLCLPLRTPPLYGALRLRGGTPGREETDHDRDGGGPSEADIGVQPNVSHASTNAADSARPGDATRSSVKRKPPDEVSECVVTNGDKVNDAAERSVESAEEDKTPPTVLRQGCVLIAGGRTNQSFR